MVVRTLVLFSLFSAPMVWGQNLRGFPVGTLKPEEAPLEFTIDNLVDIALPEASPLNSYAVLILEIPREALRFRQLIGVSLYTNLRPRFRADFRNYIAHHIDTEILPPTQRYEIRIPLHRGVRLPPARDSWNLPAPLNPNEGNPALVLMPLDKEIPDGLSQLRFRLSLKVGPSNQGGVRIRLPELTPVEREKVGITVDGVRQAWAETVYVNHGSRLFGVLDSPLAYAPATVTIEAGKVIDLYLKPQETDSWFVWDLPEGAQVRLNGVTLTGTPLRETKVDPGTWQISVTLGGTELNKVLEISRPGRFTVSLNMELLVDGD